LFLRSNSFIVLEMLSMSEVIAEMRSSTLSDGALCRLGTLASGLKTYCP